MLLKIWNFLRGYVIIEVSGFSVERFINLAVRQGVYIWDVSRSSSAAAMKVSVKAFKLLKPCAKKTNCKIKIVGKQGAPFVAYRYRKRKLLAAGLLFFVFALYFLSSFVWLVEIEGTERLADGEITAFLNDNGLGVGALKFNINKKQLEKDLQANFPDIAWVNISLRGTRALVSLTEIIPKRQLVDRTLPSDIIAKKDGLIVSISASAGTPKFRRGDVVRAGDVLVSGELSIGNEDTGITKQYVHAQADVRAKMYYDMRFTVPLSYSEKVYTGKTKKYYGLKLFDNQLGLFPDKPPYTNCERGTVTEQLQLGPNYPLPAFAVTDEYREFRMVERTRTEEQAKLFAEELITSRIIREFNADADIVERRVSFEPDGDFLNVSAVIITVEKIDEVRTLQMEQNAGHVED